MSSCAGEIATAPHAVIASASVTMSCLNWIFIFDLCLLDVSFFNSFLLALYIVLEEKFINLFLRRRLHEEHHL